MSLSRSLSRSRSMRKVAVSSRSLRGSTRPDRGKGSGNGTGKRTYSVEPSILPRELVARQLSISTTTLLRYEDRGLVRSIRSGEVEGYGPAEIRRLWSITTFQRDLGINLAGIEVILQLKDQMDFTRERLDHLARSLREIFEEEGSNDVRG
ncbi:chaperone modulator CbpM [Tundrisphaera lichenicola]|uniref:chaperone modulator CbpM n=1 Tax=Tundrisphaera lichenicola TaxID=2029860 RepID=UPI003EBE4FAA